MNIGIDIDDTISNTYDVLFSYAQKYTIIDLKKEIKPPKDESEIQNQYTKKFHGWTQEELMNFHNTYCKEIFENVSPKMYASEIINKLKNEGNKIYIITARFDAKTYNIEEVTKKWLDKYNILYDEIIINAGKKEIIAKNKKIDVFIDDSYENCRSISELGIKTCMMNSIKNVNVKDDKITRVYSWLHFYQEIQKYEEDLNGSRRSNRKI